MCGLKDAPWAFVTMRMASMSSAPSGNAPSSPSRQRMRKPVPELSRCCLLLHGSLYDRETLVSRGEDRDANGENASY